MMQKKFSIRLLLILLLSLFWGASPLQAESDNALLWRITTPDGAISHLFGTIHSDDPRVLNLPKPVAEAYDSAAILVLEMDLGTVDKTKMGQAMMLPPEKDLLSLAGPELYQQSVIALGERGYPEGAVNRLQPWAVAMTLSMPQPESGLFLDYVLFTGAQEQGKKVEGLERLEEQLGVFTGLSREDQVTLLSDTLSEYKQYPQLFEQLIKAYLERDLAALMAINEQEMASSDEALQQRLMKTLVDDRNHRMAKRLLPLLEKGSTFAAVGALHLPGKEGLITLLRQRGMKVTPIY